MKHRPNNFKESPGQYARGEFSRRHFSVLHKLTVCDMKLNLTGDLKIKINSVSG